jgi:hypothetical protein
MNLKEISNSISLDIENYSVEKFFEPPRSHLGGSMIGEPCERKLWLGFRWAYHVKHTGRQYRLFNRGHSEEPRFEMWLKGAGFQIWTQDEKGFQFRVSSANGHLGGSLDAIIKMPIKYCYEKPILGEFKTNGTGKKFDELISFGVKFAKPIHYAQMCFYGSDPNYKFDHALYLNVNKNDDTIHTELVELDNAYGQQLRDKGIRIVNALASPDRAYSSKTNFNCKYCDAAKVCWGEEKALVNCRSCRYAAPGGNSNWFCKKHENVIPVEFIPKGCGDYKCIV